MAIKTPTWGKEDLRRLAQREMGDYLLVMVSNRQPYVHELVDGELRYAVPSGGLITALDPLMQESGGTWVAHGGGKGDWYAVDEQNKVLVPPDDPAYTLRLVWLTEEEERGYYYGFSNEALWPLCHTAYTEPVFDQTAWESYKAVNQEFANQVLNEIDGRPAAVFTQDYHLLCCPGFCGMPTPTSLPASSGTSHGPALRFSRYAPGRRRSSTGCLATTCWDSTSALTATTS